MRQSTLLVALSALTVAVAQNFTVDPAVIDPTIRTEWCNAEFNTCGILCGGSWEENNCTPNDLKFACTCQNGSAPGLQYYLQSMPTLLCEQSFKDCIAKNIGDSQAQSKCTTDIKNKCGTLDPSKYEAGNGDPVSSSPSASGTAASTSGGAPATTTSSRAAAVPTMAAHLGNSVAAVAAGVLVAALL